MAGALRFWRLGGQGVWPDEAATWLLTRGTWGALLDYLRADVHPPLFYGAVWLWGRIGGFSEASLRAVSASAGTLTVPLLAWAVSRISRTPRSMAGLWAGLFLALSAFHLHYSQEAKAYALLLLLCVAAAGCWAAALDAASRRGALAWAGGFVLLQGAALHVHMAGAFLLPGFALAGLVRQRGLPPLRRLLRAAVAGLPGLLALPWLLFVAGRSVENVEGALAWARPLYEARFPLQPLWSLVAWSPATAPPARNLLQWVVPEVLYPEGASSVLVGAGVLLAVGLAGLGVARRGAGSIMALALTAIPLAVLLAVSPWRLVYLVGRTDAVALPFFLLLCGLGAAGLVRSRGMGAGVLLAVVWSVLCFEPLAAHYLVDTRSQERLLMARVEEIRATGRAQRADDVVVVTGERYAAALYYLRGPGAATRDVPEPELEVFPAELIEHPAWEDVRSYDAAELREEAEERIEGWRGQGVFLVHPPPPVPPGPGEILRESLRQRRGPPLVTSSLPGVAGVSFYPAPGRGKGTMPAHGARHEEQRWRLRQGPQGAGTTQRGGQGRGGAGARRAATRSGEDDRSRARRPPAR